jgi:hypothetical protein
MQHPLRWFLLAFSLHPFLTAQQFSVLVYTETKGWHHDSIPAAIEAVEALGALHHFTVTTSGKADPYFTDEGLAPFDVVIFLLTSGDVLDAEQQGAMERFVQAGKGFVGVHSAADTEYEWPWYRAMVGRMFHQHPAIQTASVQVEDRNFPGMDAFPERFLFTEEWYEFQAPDNDTLKTLLTVDESTYEPVTGMGDFHPVSWFHEYDGGRAFYTALGHLPATHADPRFRHHLFGGIYWAATGQRFHSKQP